jgi:hypothetical protein
MQSVAYGSVASVSVFCLEVDSRRGLKNNGVLIYAFVRHT